MTTLDPVRFPRASAYLSQLPYGLDSFPECTCRTDVARIILDEFPTLLATGLPPGLPRILTTAVRSKDVIPDVWGVLLRLMLRDGGVPDDASFLKWHAEMSAKVFATPMYRMLMHVLSPTLVLAGAQRRWNAYRTGTHLSSEGDKRGATLKLAYPKGLYTHLVVRCYAELFRASLQAAKAQDVLIAVTSHTPTETTYSLSWR